MYIKTLILPRLIFLKIMSSSGIPGHLPFKKSQQEKAELDSR